MLIIGTKKKMQAKGGGAEVEVLIMNIDILNCCQEYTKNMKNVKDVIQEIRNALGCMMTRCPTLCL